MENLPLNRAQGVTSRSLAKLIFNAEVPEEYIRAVPAQSLFLAVKQNGLGSSADLIAAAGIEQCRLLMDFDCWHKDHFVEENFWEWLGLCDADQSLDLLHKIASCMDLKLTALLIARYVQVCANEEPTDAPPGKDFYSPDKGRTWLKVEANDSHRNFLLSRLLAAIFEENADLFYQLISIPALATPSMLEEDAYLEMHKRLAAEGIPDWDYAHRLNAPLPAAVLQRELAAAAGRPAVEMIPVIEPMLYDTGTVRPLGNLLGRMDSLEEFEAEFTLIMNAALVRWGVEIYDFEQVSKLSSKVKGAINLGLEEMLHRTEFSDLEIYHAAGLQKLYSCGLDSLFALRKLALTFSGEALSAAALQSAAFAVIAGLREPFPEMPVFFLPDGTHKTDAAGVLEKGYKAVEHLSEVESLKRFLEKQKPSLQ